jgi:phosphatidylglycerol---prolipoprotein diacylglyceryl transferase
VYPVLFNLGQLTVHTYGFLIAIGFLTAVWIVRTLAIRSGLDANRVVDLCFCCLLSGFVGARLLYVITQWSVFASDPVSIFKFWEGGLVFYGGPLMAFPVGMLFLRFYRMPSGRLLLWPTYGHELWHPPVL